MKVLLAEADVPYSELYTMEQINPEFLHADVALVVGTNDITNPAACSSNGSPISGMPILDVDAAAAVVVLKRSMGAGFAGIENELYVSLRRACCSAMRKPRWSNWSPRSSTCSGSRLLSASQRIEDDGDVQDLLQERTERGGNVAKGRNDHQYATDPHANPDALLGNHECAFADSDGVGDPADVVGRQHHVSRLRRNCRTTHAHGHADCGSGQRWSVVDTVANHRHDRVAGHNGPQFHHLLGGQQIRPDRADACVDGGNSDRRCIVTTQDHRLFDAQGAQPPDEVGNIGSERIGEHDQTGSMAIDADHRGSATLGAGRRP
jgi:hypothetical protein